MPRKPAAKSAVLDAFETLLIELGERGATTDAVAARAGVSKGGLLYHYPNKDALIGALLDRFEALSAEETAAMKAAPEGAAAYFIRSSVWAGEPLDRAYVAVARLAEVANAETLRRFNGVQEQWLEVLTAELGPDVALAVQYMSDGLYLKAIMTNGGGAELDPEKNEAEIQALLRVLEVLRGSRPCSELH